MKKKLMVKTEAFTFKYMTLLKRTYPELATTVDWNGLYKNVLARLRQFNMTNNYSPDEIIIETISRWNKKTKKGEQVPNVEAWMKLTALNCIRELYRQDNRVTTSMRVNLHDPSTFETNPSLLQAVIAASETTTEEEGEDRWQQVREVMSKLPEDKRELLELRIIEELSWNEVASHYAAQGKNVKVATLRKRGERALEGLREALLEMVRQ
ncbi:sigma-70 family RNA polymerase sigma factor [Nostoc punctiforme UO1]|uniref:RNA polymerase sigma factor n=1 Tax=Nostoc punctiforme TaxID=272131 RepID=UPI0030A7800E